MKLSRRGTRFKKKIKKIIK